MLSVLEVGVHVDRPFEVKEGNDAFLGSDLSVGGDTSLDGNLFVRSSSSPGRYLFRVSESNVRSECNLDVGGELTVDDGKSTRLGGDAQVGGILEVERSADGGGVLFRVSDSNVTAECNVQLRSDLSLLGDASFTGSNVDVANHLTVGGLFTVERIDEAGGVLLRVSDSNVRAECNLDVGGALTVGLLRHGTVTSGDCRHGT